MVHGVSAYPKRYIIYITQILKEYLVQCRQHIRILIGRGRYGNRSVMNKYNLN